VAAGRAGADRARAAPGRFPVVHAIGSGFAAVDWCLLCGGIGVRAVTTERQPYGMHRGMLVHQGATAGVCRAANNLIVRVACREHGAGVPVPNGDGARATGMPCG
jgi:hypothetical protein